MTAARADVTEKLSRLAEKRLRGLTPYWAGEVMVGEDACSSGVVDYMGVRFPGNARETLAEGDVERASFVFVEVKSCIDDFVLGHGLNFQGDENWLVCERVLADELKERMLVPAGIEVFVPDRSETRLVKYVDTGSERTRRRHSAAFLLTRILMRTTSKRRIEEEGDPDCLEEILMEEGWKEGK